MQPDTHVECDPIDARQDANRNAERYRLVAFGQKDAKRCVQVRRRRRFSVYANTGRDHGRRKEVNGNPSGMCQGEVGELPQVRPSWRSLIDAIK